MQTVKEAESKIILGMAERIAQHVCGWCGKRVDGDEERLERINLLILSVRAKQAEIAQQPAIEGTATEAKEGENANG